ncbi:hypothetical protein [Solihabitans fulvus]|uniref:hypothetical protein n=1 Tax=Solihabitans fulvus TaxID=1892852 RepID=UPI0016619A45|nr:hypothetical protein [Solihabitans fulvus]
MSLVSRAWAEEAGRPDLHEADNELPEDAEQLLRDFLTLREPVRSLMAACVRTAAEREEERLSRRRKS